MTASASAPTLRVAAFDLRQARAAGQEADEALQYSGADVVLVTGAPLHPAASYRITGWARESGLTWTGSHHAANGATVLSSLGVDVIGTGHRRLGWGQGYVVTQISRPGMTPVTFVGVQTSSDPLVQVDHVREILDAEPVRQGGPLVIAGAWHHAGLAREELARVLGKPVTEAGGLSVHVGRGLAAENMQGAAFDLVAD